jgi:uncharacterized protein
MRRPIAIVALMVALLLAAGCATALKPGSEAVALKAGLDVVHGTLLVPEGRGRVPVALIISGSGPTDRDGNSTALPGPNNSLRMLAEGLAANGIASLRYDKRGIAASRKAAPSEADMRFDQFIEDAAAWIRTLRADSRFSTVTVIGHSEGSLIGMVAARDANADAYVSIAGPGENAAETLREQLKPQLPPALYEETERNLEKLVAGETVPDASPLLAPLFRPSVQSYLISWFRHDPAKEIARLKVPVMIVQGTTDLQVKVDDAKALQAAAPRAELMIVEGMNHVLKNVSGDLAAQLPSYSHPALPLPAPLTERISAFIRGVKKP